jgi:signal transduction histidine kinase
MVASKKRDDEGPIKQPDSEHFLLAQKVSQISDVPSGRQPFWQGIQEFLFTLVITPEFLPAFLRSQIIGCLLAILAPSLVVAGISSLMKSTPLLHFYSAPIIFIVFLISLSWGALPGLLATVTGAALLVIFILLPQKVSSTFLSPADLDSTIIIVLVGFGVTLCSSRIQKAHQQARKAQCEAEIARTNLYRILMQAPLAISVVRGPNYHYELMNPSARQAYSRNAMPGKSLQEVFPEQEAQVLPLFRQIYATGEGVFVSEHRMLPKEENNTLVEQYNDISYQPLRASDGSVDGVIVMAVDVTEQVQARHSIERLLAERENFMSIIAHELRTPLTSARIGSQLVQRNIQKMLDLQQQTEPEEYELLLNASLEHLRRILDQLDFQNRLLSDLLDTSHVQAEGLELRMERYSLVQSINECIEDQRNVYPGRQIHLELPADDALMVIADPERVCQVVVNYLTNALKYSDQEKPITVSVSLQEREVSVAVRDEGPGLDEEQQKLIWESFYRAPGVQVRNGSGVSLGLGLYICRSLIEHQGGKVGVISEPGKGSTFWFTLPRS